ncbi:response regulator transcription factor [Nisaea sp.]|uniref:response regulator transcription factor n=1 Tax=Nisaea sp. TaxID=2024842 RepID=UPI0032EC9AF4
MRVLLVEDTEDVAEAIVIAFGRAGYPVDHAASRDAAEAALAVQDYDVAILDINLPDGSGVDLLRTLRRSGRQFPVLMLTARLAVDDRVEALDIGADDYLMKPFDLRELEARVRALYRRQSEPRPTVLTHGDVTLDPAKQVVEMAGSALTLTRREFALLRVFMSDPERVLSKDKIFERMFAFDEEEVGINAVELYVARLRKKLDGSRLSIRTLRGLGYQLTVNSDA